MIVHKSTLISVQSKNTVSPFLLFRKFSPSSLSFEKFRKIEFSNRFWMLSIIKNWQNNDLIEKQVIKIHTQKTIRKYCCQNKVSTMKKILFLRRLVEFKWISYIYFFCIYKLALLTSNARKWKLFANSFTSCRNVKKLSVSIAYNVIHLSNDSLNFERIRTRQSWGKNVFVLLLFIGMPCAWLSSSSQWFVNNHQDSVWRQTTERSNVSFVWCVSTSPNFH